MFATDIVRLLKDDARRIKKTDWVFDWRLELLKEDREIYKLVTVANPNIWHGLVSISDLRDHIFMHLIESASFNKGAKKIYCGVPGNLVAFACKRSFELGYEGIVAFVAKTQLIKHYKETLGAKQFSWNRLYLDSPESYKLVNLYLKMATKKKDIKRLDDKDVIFVDDTWTESERKEFSEFLKSRQAVRGDKARPSAPKRQKSSPK